MFAAKQYISTLQNLLMLVFKELLFMEQYTCIISTPTTLIKHRKNKIHIQEITIQVKLIYPLYTNKILLFRESDIYVHTKMNMKIKWK